MNNTLFDDCPLVTSYGWVNPAGSLTVLAGVPSIGSSMTFGVDNPLGTQGTGSLPTVYLSMAPDPNYPCGRLLPGFGSLLTRRS